MRLDPGPIPLYHQLERNLRARIHAGEFTEGAALPTEGQICKHYGVSRITVRRALDALIAQGLITKRQGVGSFVAERRTDVRSVRLVGSLDEFLATAGTLDTKLISLEHVEAPSEVAEALRLDPDGHAVRLELTTALDGALVGHLELFIPPWAAVDLSREDVETGTPTIRILEKKLNLRIARAEQLIGAGVAGATAALHLGLAPGDPVLKVMRVYYAADGRPVEAVLVRYHPEHYRYAIEFQAGPPNA